VFRDICTVIQRKTVGRSLLQCATHIDAAKQMGSLICMYGNDLAYYEKDGMCPRGRKAFIGKVLGDQALRKV
jgi:hypothetical protein